MNLLRKILKLVIFLITSRILKWIKKILHSYINNKIMKYRFIKLDQNFSILISPENSNAFLARTRETFSLPLFSQSDFIL